MPRRGQVSAGDPRAADPRRGLSRGRPARRPPLRRGRRAGAADEARRGRVEEARRLRGQGALAAWLRISAVRTAISLGRKRRELAIEDEALEAIADEGDDQALAFLKTSYRNEFKRAFAAALAALSKRSRTLLRLQINDQLTLEEIGAFYRVSRATAARWLAEARADLVKRTRAQLMTSLGLPAEELSKLMRLVASNLYGTLPGLLRQTEGGEEPGQ
ncbi:sigma-70 family RNA polymerase sigma factor [Nannocystis pusilla]|uniref:sigma-70 family RNA polymerase sigma factor n=1 Tax=Nannocystis pusilla TaxID=889268 RepID=UPI003B824BA7